jgi:hypothetical protein
MVGNAPASRLIHRSDRVDSAAIVCRVAAEIASLEKTMKRVGATEAKNRLGAILDDAQRET